jgi:hypothetical protein
MKLNSECVVGTDPCRSARFQLPDDYCVVARKLAPEVLPTESLDLWSEELGIPTLGEWVRQALAAGKPAWLLEFSQHGSVLTQFPVWIETRKVRRLTLRTLSLAGYDFYDYLPMPMGDVPECIWLLGIRRLCKHFRVDSAYLNHIAAEPPESFEKFSQTFSNLCFDQSKGRGWQEITGVESARRIVNKAKRLHRYRVESHEGLLPPELLELIAQFHIERWAYDGIESPFMRSSRRNEYAANQQRLLSTIIFDADTVIAAHVGLVFGKRLMWHTPVINIAYLATSPLKLLLQETICECARRKIGVLDLGLGDEPYKSRYSNTKRTVWNVFIPHTVLGYLVSVLLNLQPAPRLRMWFTNCRAGLTRMWARKPCILAPSSTFADAAHPSASVVWTEIGRFEDCVQFCREFGLTATRLDHDRIKEGSRCLYAVEAGSVIGKCWIRHGSAWTDTSSPFSLFTPHYSQWVFDCVSLNGASLMRWFPRLSAIQGKGDCRWVIGPDSVEERIAAKRLGFAAATDVTYHRSAAAKPAKLS